ncbi:DUF1836 domain-containing protein [Lactiplantibacillus daowaiensis]|uniref:DUF1836 domain-containing protein n=1 Tax=Lactiplantibacillus daowaiensis TaxID=2559918 RepID=A0ABW1S2T1_9LACO|nr:DUF1836 domain-containing protein [Lactiplantibacillus daowaiensis]
MTTTLAEFKLPTWDTLPVVPIYMEQLLQLVNLTLAPLELPAVTKTMVNSYVKQHFFSRPTGRQYTRNHLVAVLVVTLLKTDFSLTTISQAILKIRDSRQIEARYQEFTIALMQGLRQQPVTISATDTTSQAIQFAAQTVASHLLTQQALA